ncbi:beta-N-acetylhexosaminidase [Coraliomargarita akajimensis]|uniref:Glycoside hydrolase, family 20, catalytic core n=1 Tax=Coraliomargarita akajimensis (strain DSM 45221 / IAM 15411 / JCM 23193 / KCTC 12865 / 04OKA010-24) TaxID=583355 RepID=D5EM76_CORAD|nr:beta-N-acetylhexosaminidase [Coraliomargarita akajimensis]ADE55236.1 Glycoside hydrolase, family 20, catalytic core [Coraliomargarita akajimensis DSM 45221]
MNVETQLFGDRAKPAFERRGLMLDVSRNRVPTMATLKRLIDALERLRYNELQLYMEHSFAYREHEVVWHECSPFTPPEIQELDTYCKQRGIELIPNQNSFGHMERWLKHPAYQYLAECPNGFEHPIAGWRETGGTLYPCTESLEFVRALYAELLPHFSSKQLHIGGDEPWELGKGRSAQRVEREGKYVVYLDFLARLLQIANELGNKPQFWADILLEQPQLVSHLPKNCHPVIWGYDADSPYDTQCRQVAEAGFAHNYSVAPGAGNWNSFGGRLDIARQNIARAAKYGIQYQAQGYLLTAWGDNGHHQPWSTLYPSLILAAQAAWGAELASDALPTLLDSLFELEPGDGKRLCQLGAIDSLLPQPLPPVSFLHAAFFSQSSELSELRARTTEHELKTAQRQLQSLLSECTGPSELQLGVEMNLAAIARILDQPITEQQLHQLATRFSEEWLKHSRPGGLKDSLQRLEIYNQGV